MSANPYLEKAHLDGRPFYWKAGHRGVLLIHGLSATTAEVRPLANALLAAGYTVAAPLLPGHGTHPRDLNQVSWQDWYNSVDTFYRRLQAECSQVVVGGESTGAVLSLNAAVHHPEITALVLFAPALRLSLNPLEILFLRMIAPFVPWVKPRKGGPDLQWQGYSVRPTRAILQLIALGAHVRANLPQVSNPLMVVQGRLDRTVHSSVPAIISSQVKSPVKRIYWLEHSTHCVILDQEADKVIELTNKFLNEVWGMP